MTKEDLKKMGIIHVGGTIHPYRFFIPNVGDVNLYEPYSFSQIFERIYDSGIDAGVRMGEAKKVQEIKKVLDIETM